MYRILLLSVLYFHTLCTHSQGEQRLYIVNTDIINQIVESIDVKYKDDTERASFKRAILESFENYWREKKVKTKLKVSEFNNLNNQRIIFQAEVDSLQDKIRELSGNAEQFNGKQLYEQLREARNGAESVENKLREKKNELEDYLTQLKNFEEVTESDNTIVALITGIEQEIKKAHDICIGSLSFLSSADVELLRQASSDFKDNDADLKVLDPSQYDALTNMVKTINKYLPVCESIRNALVQMGKERYNEQANEKLKRDLLTNLRFATNIPRKQRLECDAIIYALDNEKTAYSNINYIIDDILSSFPNFDLENTLEVVRSLLVKKDVLIVENGKIFFNKYYGIFNNVLENLRKIPRHNITTKNKLESYLEEERSKL